MSLKKAVGALLACLIIGAAFASAASAAPTTENSFWYVSGSKLASGSTAAVSCSKGGTENLILKSKVLGSEVELSATGIECVESTIKQEGSSAQDAGKLKFTGVKVVKPAGCSTATTLTTVALKSEIYMEGTTTYDRFEPATGATEKFLSVSLTGCAAEGSYPVKGYTYGVTNATNTAAATQPVTFNSSSNAVSALTLGTETATLTGVVNNKLTSGAEFKANKE